MSIAKMQKWNIYPIIRTSVFKKNTLIATYYLYNSYFVAINMPFRTTH